MTAHPDFERGHDKRGDTLSAAEVRRLSEISAHLQADDPDLAAFLRSERPRRGGLLPLRRRVLLGALFAAVVFLTAMVVLSFHLVSPVLFFLSGPPLALAWIAVFRFNQR